jgi:hypothetical protein
LPPSARLDWVCVPCLPACPPPQQGLSRGPRTGLAAAVQAAALVSTLQPCVVLLPHILERHCGRGSAAEEDAEEEDAACAEDARLVASLLLRRLPAGVVAVATTHNPDAVSTWLRGEFDAVVRPSPPTVHMLENILVSSAQPSRSCLWRAQRAHERNNVIAMCSSASCLACLRAFAPRWRQPFLVQAWPPSAAALRCCYPKLRARRAPTRLPEH